MNRVPSWAFPVIVVVLTVCITLLSATGSVIPDILPGSLITVIGGWLGVTTPAVTTSKITPVVTKIGG